MEHKSQMVEDLSVFDQYKPTTIYFDCEVVSPLFMYGINKNEPELREESFIGALHFWYRALWGHLKPISEIKLEEDILFGSNEKAGILDIRLKLKDVTSKSEYYKPHKHTETIRDRTISNYKKAISSGSFQIEISQEVENLFKLSAILGGFGGRSRRGFGCLEIQTFSSIQEVQNQIVDLISQIIPQTCLSPSTGQNGETVLAFPSSALGNKYPFIEKIYIRKSCIKSLDQALIKINQSTSDLQKKHNAEYNKQMGDGRNRFASPVVATLVQVNDEYLIIATKLKSVPNVPNNINSSIDLPSEYINLIMS
jgi:CRISPR-associated protein Cmr1